MDYRAFAADNARREFQKPEPLPERFFVDFEKTNLGGYDHWTLDFDTLEDAREMAESYVDDKDADRATVTARHAPIHEEYSDGEWDVDEAYAAYLAGPTDPRD
jgi:hypothetical protein